MAYYREILGVVSSYANRGNVAVICWNTLNSKKWGVTGEEYDGVTLGDNEDVKTLLAINFSEFTTEKGDEYYKAGSLKETDDDVIVKSTPERNAEIGDRQIVLSLSEGKFTTVYDSFDFAKQPKKAVRETKTYKDGDDVVAYVPENVWKDLNTLKNHKVTVVFGEENEVALIVVSDESINEAYVTAWNKDELEIEIDGTTYEVNKDAEVSLFGYELTHEARNNEVADYTAVRAISDIFTTLGITNPKKVVNRTISASVILDEDGDIEKIDFMASQNFGTATIQTADEEVLLGMQEGVVKSISSKGVVKGYGDLTSMFDSRKLEEVADEDEPRVIKDGKIASLDDIEEGDVVTAIFTKTSSSADPVYKLVYVSSERVTGSVSKVKNDALTINGEVYNTVNRFIVNKNGDIEDAEVPSSSMDWKDLYDEDVELYLNHMEEVVAIVASTEATDLTVGILTRNAAKRDDTDKDVEYLSVKILTKDGTKKTYKVYNDDKDEDVTLNASNYTAGKAVLFSADANGIIEQDEIFIIGEGNYAVGEEIKDLDGKDLTIVKVTNYSNYDDKKLNTTYRYTTSTIGFNTKVDEAEVISKGWGALVSKSGNATISGDAYALVDTDTNRVVYYIANITSYAGTSDNYALLVDIELTKDSDDDKIYTATLFENGKEVSYEIDENELTATLSTISSIKDANAPYTVLASEKDFVKYELSNDKITAIETVANVDGIKDLADEAVLGTLIPGIASTAVKASLEVRTVVDDDIFFTDKAKDTNGNPVTELDELVIDEDGCIIYDLRDGEYEMFTGERSDLENLLVYGFAADCGTGYVDILVILD